MQQVNTYRGCTATVTPQVAYAGEKGRWCVEVSLHRPLSPGAKVRLKVGGGRHNKSDWSYPQVTDPTMPEYWCAETSGGEVLEAVISEEEGNKNQLVDFIVPESGLKAGDQVSIYVGGKAGDDGLATAQMFSQKAKEFEVFVDIGEGEWSKVDASPRIEVKGTMPERLSVFVPSIVKRGEPLRVFIKAEDRFGNVAPSFRDEVHLGWAEREMAPLCERTAFSEQDEGAHSLEGWHLGRPGVYRLSVSAKEKSYLSNPILCTDEDRPRLYWGMIHGHTALSDGLGTPEAYYDYMRVGCGLDFGAISDHDHEWETLDEYWEHIQRATAEANAPGEFVTLLGYEWAKWRRNGDGDRCVYYPEDRGPMLRSGEAFYPRPADLYRALNPRALVIPHHTAYVGNHCDWKDYDPLRDRLVEIYSVWGNSERSVNDGNPYPVKGGHLLRYYPTKAEDADEMPLGFVQNALAQGWRVGFTAGGDDHRSHPGDHYRPLKGPRSYTAGLMAVYAEELTRASLWEGLWNRRCYGTTGARIIVEFTVNGQPMGSEIVFSDADEVGARILRARVIGTAPIAKIEVVRNNQEVYTYEGSSFLEELEWEDRERLDTVLLPPTPHAASPFTFYYLRVTQSDGEMAWASPVWLSVRAS